MALRGADDRFPAIAAVAVPQFKQTASRPCMALTAPAPNVHLLSPVRDGGMAANGGFPPFPLIRRRLIAKIFRLDFRRRFHM